MSISKVGASYLKDVIEKDLVLKNLGEYSEDVQINILDQISPDNFSDMIYVSEIYLSNPNTKQLFIDKMKQIINWKIYFDQEAPPEFIDVFFTIATESLPDITNALYYLVHYKLPVYLFEKHFDKIHNYALIEYNYDRKLFKEKSTLYYAIFVVQSKKEIIQIFDFLIENVERKGNLDNPYTDVLLMLIDYLKTIDIQFHVYDTPVLPENRLKRLENII
jgi:hypothetical protein